jgi:NADPH:quinone reductase-like Zn-dependent oxidoreductase
MDGVTPVMMKAAAIERFGGPGVFRVRTLSVPRPKPNEVLIRLETAGIGVWDPYAREGELDNEDQGFPQIIGNDGAGTVVAVGSRVRRFRPGDRVYAYTMNGGFYAEYVAVKQDQVAQVPRGVKLEEAGALGAVGITALRGLDDQLHVKRGQRLMIFGASGGIGHVAVQLAKRMGARVLAIASGLDGVRLVRRLGADAVVDGRKFDVAAAAARFAPKGFDAALVTTGGKDVSAVLRAAMKKGGRVAYPNGVEPPPRAPKGVKLLAYDGTPTRQAFDRLNRLIGRERFHVALERTYSLAQAAAAHRELGKHHVGKAAFRLH